MAAKTTTTTTTPAFTGVSSIHECQPLLERRAALLAKRGPLAARRDAALRSIEGGPANSQELHRPARFELDTVGPEIAGIDNELDGLAVEIAAVARKHVEALAAPVRTWMAGELEAIDVLVAGLAARCRNVVEVAGREKGAGLPVGPALGLPPEQLRAPFPGARLTAVQIAFLALELEKARQLPAAPRPGVPAATPAPLPATSTA